MMKQSPAATRNQPAEDLSEPPIARTGVRRKLSQFLDNGRLLFVCSLAVLLVSLGMLLLALYVNHQTSESNRALAMSTAATRKAPLRMGQVITQGAVALQVSNPSYTAGSGPMAAPAGKQYLILTFSARNRTDAPIHVLPASDTYVKDTSGHVIYLTPFALSQPFRAGELLPGERISGQVSYLVPSSGKLSLYIDAIWSGGVIPIGVR